MRKFKVSAGNAVREYTGFDQKLDTAEYVGVLKVVGEWNVWALDSPADFEHLKQYYEEEFGYDKASFGPGIQVFKRI